ncbi:hypothetical protein EIP86_004048 [Pleurotus ostreatoroseus]|nr:hypothetical protein EIP86_004048 [Pleurotus ostreatoroseus]
MAVEESVRYSLTDPESELEWLWTGPIGDHHVRLGQPRRAFAVPMFHQLHCLRTIRELIDRGGLHRFPRAYGHVHHCFVYLRQWTLCSADVTLEPGDFMQRNFTIERVGATHTCQDWEPVYDMVADNWKAWERYRDAHGLPEPLD